MEIIHNDDNTVNLTDLLLIDATVIGIDRLNRALIENGVSDTETRKKICETVTFDIAYLVDAGWIEREGKRYFPKVCLAEREVVVEDEATMGLDEIQRLHVPTEASSMHEYALGNVDYYFEELGEELSEIKFGNYDSEGFE